MAGRKKNGGDDTDTTIEDLFRDFTGTVMNQFDAVHSRLDAVSNGVDEVRSEMRAGFKRLDDKIDAVHSELSDELKDLSDEVKDLSDELKDVKRATLMRDRKLDARVSRLETRVGKKRKKPSAPRARLRGRSSSAR